MLIDGLIPEWGELVQLTTFRIQGLIGFMCSISFVFIFFTVFLIKILGGFCFLQSNELNYVNNYFCVCK